MRSANTYNQLYDPLIPAKYAQWYEQKLISVLDGVHDQLMEQPHAVSERVSRLAEQMLRHQTDTSRPLTHYFLASGRQNDIKENT